MRVALFIPCFVDQLAPEVGVSTVRVLRRLGVEVEYPTGQTCCGQPAFNSGYQDDARAVAEHFLDVFDRTPARYDYIVCPSGSCTAMVANYYPHLFAESARRAPATRTARKVREFSDFLVNVLGVEDVGATLPGRAVYHLGCHQRRELGNLSAPERLLAHVRGLEMLGWANDTVCCGFGGTFSVKMPDVSAAMADEKVRAFAASGADTLISGDSSCLMQIAGRLRATGHGDVRVLHLAQVLDSVGTINAVGQ